MSRITYAMVAAAATCATLTACGGGVDQPPAQPPIPPSALTSAAPVMMGDSITYNWSGEDESVPLTTSIYQLVPSVIDMGISGETSAMMAARFQTDVLDYSPTIVVILAGTNDIRSGLPIDVSNVAEMASEAAAAGAKVILCTLPPSPALDQSAIDEWDADVEALAAAQGYQLADYHNAMMGAAGPDIALFISDQVHPNASGYANMWAVLESLLRADGVQTA